MTQCALKMNNFQIKTTLTKLYGNLYDLGIYLESLQARQKPLSAVHNLKSNKCKKYPSCARMLNHMGTLETMKKIEKIFPPAVRHTMSP